MERMKINHYLPDALDKLGKSLLCYVYVKNLLRLLMTFVVIAVCRYNYNLKYRHNNLFLLLKTVYNVLYTKFYLGFFF